MAGDEVVLKAEGLTGPTGFKDVSFELHKGEILGFFGLVGAGRTETMRAVFGADMITGGKVWLKGKRVNTSSWNTSKALKAGIGLIPEDRKTQGFLKLMSNTQNISISSLEDYVNAFNLLVDSKKRANAEHFFKELEIHPNNPDYLTLNMSGGNQQKVILARWMSTKVDIIIFDEPTKGVDVGAKAEIYRLMEEMIQNGKSIIVISSELPEVMGFSDRIVVMGDGRVNKVLNRSEFGTSDQMLDYAIGGSE